MLHVIFAYLFYYYGLLCLLLSRCLFTEYCCVYSVTILCLHQNSIKALFHSSQNPYIYTKPQAYECPHVSSASTRLECLHACVYLNQCMIHNCAYSLFKADTFVSHVSGRKTPAPLQLFEQSIAAACKVSLDTCEAL